VIALKYCDGLRVLCNCSQIFIKPIIDRCGKNGRRCFRLNSPFTLCKWHLRFGLPWNIGHFLRGSKSMLTIWKGRCFFWSVVKLQKQTIIPPQVSTSDLACAEGMLLNFWMDLAHSVDRMESIVLVWECCATVPEQSSSLLLARIKMDGVASTSTHHLPYVSAPWDLASAQMLLLLTNFLAVPTHSDGIQSCCDNNTRVF